MSLRAQLNESLKEAMKAREPRRVSTLRLMLAALKDRDIASRSEENREGVSDDEILSLLARMIKQREESAETYEKGGRPGLAEAEREEIAIIRAFMPQPLDEDATKAAVRGVIAEVGAGSMKDMGKVMAALKERYAGQMDFGKAGGIVKAMLAAG